MCSSVTFNNSSLASHGHLDLKAHITLECIQKSVARRLRKVLLSLCSSEVMSGVLGPVLGSPGHEARNCWRESNKGYEDEGTGASLGQKG